MTTTRDDHLFRELDHRESDGISVSLLWRRRDDAVAVAVHDECTDQSFRLRVAATKALDAFRHPFAYLEPSGFGLAAS